MQNLRRLVCWSVWSIIVNSALSEDLKRPSESEHVTRFKGLYLQSTSAAVGIYAFTSKDEVRLQKELRTSLDNVLPEKLPADIVAASFLFQTTDRPHSILLIKYSDIPSSINPATSKATGYKAFPIFDDKVVYFMSQPPQPLVVLTVKLQDIEVAVKRQNKHE
jgi:hypothetical protein